MAAKEDDYETPSKPLLDNLPPNNNAECLPDQQTLLLPDQKPNDEPTTKSDKTQNNESVASVTASNVKHTLSVPEVNDALPRTPSGKLEALPHKMTSTPMQDANNASSGTANPTEQILNLSLTDNPLSNCTVMGNSLGASGTRAGVGSDSGSRADDEAEVNTSFTSQLSTNTVTNESQTDLDLYDQMSVPIVGYEIMEPRSKFTVYKLRVQKSKDEGWHIFRRFSDFVRLNDTLKQVFPHFRLALPPKRWIGDNYERNFIDDRLLGLQAFLNNVVSHRDVCNSEALRTFLCIDDPPGPHDSLEESRALCEMLEEKQYRLTQDLQSRDSKIALLEEEISLYKDEVENLRRALRSERASLSHKRVSPSSQPPSESSLTEHDEASEAEADQVSISKSSSTLTTPEGMANTSEDLASQCASLLLTTVDNNLSLDKEIKASERILEKASLKQNQISSKADVSEEKCHTDEKIDKAAVKRAVVSNGMTS